MDDTISLPGAAEKAVVAVGLLLVFVLCGLLGYRYAWPGVEAVRSRYGAATERVQLVCETTPGCKKASLQLMADTKTGRTMWFVYIHSGFVDPAHAGVLLDSARSVVEQAGLSSRGYVQLNNSEKPPARQRRH